MSAPSKDVARAARGMVDARTEDTTTASPFDVLAAALFDVIADRVHGALLSPDFTAALRARGFTIAPIVDGDLPAAPAEWMQQGIDLYGAEGTSTDLVGQLDALWQEAFEAGWHARTAAEAQA